MKAFLKWLNELLEAIVYGDKPIHDPTPAPPVETPVIAPQPQSEPIAEPVSTYDWSTPEAVRYSLRVIGDEYHMTVLQKDLLCDICKCESSYKLNARLENSPTSIDRGLFQWNSRWNPQITDDIAYDPEKATRLACKAILNKQAMVFWKASSKCWNKTGKYDSLLVK